MTSPAASPPPPPVPPPPAPPEPPAPSPATLLGRLWSAIRGIPTEALGHERAIYGLWGLGASGLIAFAMAGPILIYGDEVQLARIGLLIGLAVLALHTVYVDKGIGRYLWLGTFVFSGLWGASELIGASWVIADNARANDARCLAIQRDMLAARPRRPDGPALFQALGCSPQGQQTVAFPIAASAPRPVSASADPRAASGQTR